MLGVAERRLEILIGARHPPAQHKIIRLQAVHADPGFPIDRQASMFTSAGTVSIRLLYESDS